MNGIILIKMEIQSEKSKMKELYLKIMNIPQKQKSMDIMWR